MSLEAILQELELDEGAAAVYDITDANLRALCQEVVAADGNAKQLQKFRNGKRGVVKYFVGEVMRATRGVADPKLAEAIVLEVLGEGASSS